jgi:hypothetical protein
MTGTRGDSRATLTEVCPTFRQKLVSTWWHRLQPVEKCRNSGRGDSRAPAVPREYAAAAACPLQ